MRLDLGIILKLLHVFVTWIQRNPNIFDWIPVFDDRSKKYGVRDILDKYAKIGDSVEWSQGTQLDQGKEGACVGFAWTHFMISEPSGPRRQPSVEGGAEFALDVYRKAQKIDEWEGNTSGTSILAAAKILKKEGRIKQYRWCFNLEDIRDTILHLGPVVAGVQWNRYMSRPFATGQIPVVGKFTGAHAILIDAYYPTKVIGRTEHKDVFRVKNSWGTKYGKGGSAYITGADLQKLIDLKGEFCVGLVKEQLKFNAKGFLVQ